MKAKPNRSSMFSVQCWMFDLVLTPLLFLATIGAGFGQPAVTPVPRPARLLSHRRRSALGQAAASVPCGRCEPGCEADEVLLLSGLMAQDSPAGWSES